VQLANQNQLGDHYSSKHPKEKPPSNSADASFCPAELAGKCFRNVDQRKQQQR
ncbi:unnamed protein product, partial [Ilex paraguariensis]